MKKRVLVTGANGFTGRALTQLLTDTGYEVIPLVHKAVGFVNERVIDFEDHNFCKVINSLPKVDAVIHLGANVGFGVLRRDLFNPNVFATAILINWAKKIGAYLVFSSTAIVCGDKTSKINLDTRINPDTDYGYSKWLAEELIRFSGLKHAILRISGIFGLNGPSHLTINKTIKDALNDITPRQYGSGKIKRNYIYVKDLAKVIKYCIEHKVTGTHFVAGRYVNTISEMLQIVCNILLPGQKPIYCKGKKGNNQVIEHSSFLPKGRSFDDAIKDIKNDYYIKSKGIP